MVFWNCPLMVVWNGRFQTTINDNWCLDHVGGSNQPPLVVVWNCSCWLFGMEQPPTTICLELSLTIPNNHHGGWLEPRWWLFGTNVGGPLELSFHSKQLSTTIPNNVDGPIFGIVVDGCLEWKTMVRNQRWCLETTLVVVWN